MTAGVLRLRAQVRDAITRYCVMRRLKTFMLLFQRYF